MLKRFPRTELTTQGEPAAFGRLCVETYRFNGKSWSLSQPPSGGCVLKQLPLWEGFERKIPAAFGRLCVETIQPRLKYEAHHPAAFGRLCVETLYQ